MKKKNVKLPGWCPGTLKTFLESRPGILLSNWIFQGTRYMNRYELAHRLLTECILITALFLTLYSLINPLLSLILSFLLAHTLYWSLNGHVFVLMRYLSNITFPRKKVVQHIEGLHLRIQGCSSIKSAVAFGSFSRGSATLAADFDLRLVSYQGFLNRFQTFNFCFLERMRAFFSSFPLDIYVFEPEDFEKKIKKDEPAILMIDREGDFSSYPAGTLDYEQFIAQLSES